MSIFMMSTTNALEQMVVQELLEQVVAEWVVAHSQSIIRIGNYTPGKHNGTCIVHNGGVAPTVRENHGMVTAVNVKV